MAKNDNLLAILWMLNSGDKVTAKQISEKLEMNIRTVYRYMDALSASGVPIISDSGHNGGYSLLNSFISAPLIFDMEEKKALLQAAIFAKEAGYPSSRALEAATSKLNLFSSQEQKNRLEHHLDSLEVISPTMDSAVQPVLEILEQAVSRECTVEIEYRTGREEDSKKRLIDPYGIVYWNSKWYVVGFCHLRNSLRKFRVDRILNICSTALIFKRPQSFSARAFFMKDLLPELVGGQDLVALIIDGRIEALDDLCMHWYLGYYLKERTSHRAIFLLEENLIHLYVPNFLLPYGKSIQVIEPQSLRLRLVAVASTLMDHYKLE